MLRFIVILLVIVGAINWGLWGVFQYDLVAALLGGQTAPLARIVYSIVGLAGIWSLTLLPCICKTQCCSKKEQEDKKEE